MGKGVRFTLVILKVFSPALHCVGVNQTFCNSGVCMEDCTTVLLNVLLVFLLKLEIFFGAAIKVARLPNDHRCHLVCNEGVSRVHGGK